MTKEYKVISLENRIQRLSASEKNIKSGGVLRKCTRQLRNLKNQED